MQTIKLKGTVDHQHRLVAEVPASIPAGPVEVLVVLPSPETKESADDWMQWIAHEWAAELSDSREDIYTLEDGEPVNVAR